MKLYLLRHADAETEAPTDDERPISERGRQQSKRVAAFCERRNLKPDIILTSPLRRAQQTAKIVADGLAIELKTVPWLASGAAADRVLVELNARRKLSSVMLVGHEPDFGLLVAHLLGIGKGAGVRLRKASLSLLELTAFRGGGAHLEWSIPARLM